MLLSLHSRISTGAFTLALTAVKQKGVPSRNVSILNLRSLSPVGDHDGTVVGRDEGVMVGSIVGLGVGCLVGLRVGFLVGEEDG